MRFSLGSCFGKDGRSEGTVLNILLVEDNSGDARLIQEYLAERDEQHFQLTWAQSLAEAHTLCETEMYDVVLLDLSLPDSTGLQSFTRFSQKAPALPIIVLTGLQDEGLASKAIRKGAQDYLVKSDITSSLLARAIRYAIDRKHVEEQLKRSLQEKELLIKEIHHRVKNNMQVISSLLRLQSRYIQDPDALEMFTESQARVRSMALVHENLYKSEDLGEIDFSVYVKPLAHGLYRLYGFDPGRVRLLMNVQQVFLPIDLAIPCGLIVNELVSNALKYGFPKENNQSGWIKIDMQMQGNQIQLQVEDNGVGLPDSINIHQTDSLGLHLVSMLVEDQLKGAFNLDQTGTTRFNVNFNIEND